jgi:hypothetical protein
MFCLIEALLRLTLREIQADIPCKARYATAIFGPFLRGRTISSG